MILMLDEFGNGRRDNRQLVGKLEGEQHASISVHSAHCRVDELTRLTPAGLARIHRDLVWPKPVAQCFSL